MILVTGANGFIGSALAKELNKQLGLPLLLSDYVSTDERKKLLENVNYTRLISPDDLLESLDLFKEIKLIFHMGACSSTTESRWEYLKKVNLDYSISLYKLAQKNNIPFIYASSAAVYGDGSKGFDDQQPTGQFKPLNLYGRSKAEFDIWMEENSDPKHKWAGFRFFNVFGPNEYFKENMASMAYKGFHQIQDTQQLKLFKSYHPDYEDGKQLRDFVYIKDITRWLIEVSANALFENGIYNMGYGEAKSWLDMADGLFTSLNKEMTIQWIEMPDSIKNQYQYFTEAQMDKLYKQGISKAQWPIKKAVFDYVSQHLLNSESTYA